MATSTEWHEAYDKTSMFLAEGFDGGSVSVTCHQRAALRGEWNGLAAQLAVRPQMLLTAGPTRAAGRIHGRPKRERYSIETRNALTISAARKSPPCWSSFCSQKLNPSRLWSGASAGLRRR